MARLTEHGLRRTVGVPGLFATAYGNVYLSTLHAPAGEHGFGPIAQYLLAKRPCRVIVETEPLAGRPLAARAHAAAGLAS